MQAVDDVPRVRLDQWPPTWLCCGRRSMSAASVVAGQKPSSAATSRSLSASIVTACVAVPRTVGDPQLCPARRRCAGPELGPALRAGSIGIRLYFRRFRSADAALAIRPSRR